MTTSKSALVTLALLLSAGASNAQMRDDTVGGLSADCRASLPSTNDPRIDRAILDHRLQDIARDVAHDLQGKSSSSDLISKFKRGMLDGIGRLWGVQVPQQWDVDSTPSWETITLRWIAGATGPKLSACFPDFAVELEPLAQKVAQEAAEQVRQVAREAAAVAAAKQKLADAQKVDQAAADARAKLPINILGTAYASYVTVKRCHEARDGYAAIYISSPEMDQARNAAQTIEQVLRPKLNHNTTTDYVWSQVATPTANSYPNRDYSERARSLCQSRLEALLGILRDQVPETSVMKKDF